MSTKFEWDPAKAASNLQKHNVSFTEAATVFFDPLSVTIQDPVHSFDEQRCVITRLSYQSRPLVVVHSDRGDKIRISVRGWRLLLKGRNMNQESNKEPDADMLDEYDFSGGVRGKYVNRLATGSKVVVLDPDVARVFTDSESVNEALRALATIIQNQTHKTREL